MGLLLNPAAKVIGNELGIQVKEWIEEKKRANLHHHIDEAQKMAVTRPKRKTRKRTKKISPPEQAQDHPVEPEEPSVKAIKAIEKWTEAAREVDPDEESAPIWQRILADLLNNEDVDDLVIETLRGMKSVELKELLSIEDDRFRPARNAPRDRLSEKWLLEKNLASGVVGRQYPLFFVMGIALLTASLAASIMLPEINITMASSPGIAFVKPFTWVTTALYWGTLLVYWMRNDCTIRVLKPTWLGAEIIHRAREVGFGREHY